MKVLVTDGNNRAALAITRSLGRAGYEVIVGAQKLPCLASVSRFCGKRFRYTIDTSKPEKFIDKLKTVIKTEKPNVLLPVTEITTLMVMSYKEELETNCAIPFSSYKAVNKAASKYEIVKLAQKLDIPTPKTLFMNKKSDRSIVKTFKSEDFPIVIKPSRSRIANVDGWRATGVQYAYDANELNRIIESIPDYTYPLLLQERIKGSGVGVFVCYNHGRMIASFSHRRIREKPPSGGVSVLRESISVEPELKTYSELLLNELGWHGVAMVEYKQDTLKNDYKLMEINGRFWGSLQLAIDSGVNFPLLAAKIGVNAEVTPVTEYKTGVKTRWLMGDMDSVLTRIFTKNKNLNLPEGFPGRLKYLWSFLKFWGKGLNYEILKLDDIKPWILELMYWVRGK